MADMNGAPRVGSETPWGRAQGIANVADGIVLIDTPGHGGYWLSPVRLAELRAKFPELTGTFAGFPWFEEDCDWAWVVLAFPSLFEEGARIAAKKTAEWNIARQNEKVSK